MWVSQKNCSTVADNVPAAAVAKNERERRRKKVKSELGIFVHDNLTYHSTVLLLLLLEVHSGLSAKVHFTIGLSGSKCLRIQSGELGKNVRLRDFQLIC